MNVSFTRKFRKQVDNINDKKIKSALYDLIRKFEQANNLAEIQNIKKLKGHQNYYRVRIGNYRVGRAIDKSTVIFAAIDHRSDIYKYFP